MSNDLSIVSSTIYWPTRKVTPSRPFITLEGALLVPMGPIYLQLGGGFTTIISYVNSEKGDPYTKWFFNLSGKMFSF
jgi:hypothetical protein